MRKESSLGRSRTFLGYYKSAALLLLNFLVFFILVNAGLYLLFHLKDAHTRREAEKNVTRVHSNLSLRTVYPGMDAQSIDQLIRETWSRPYAYEPFTQFKERPFRGRFVNVSEAGYRLSKDQGPWPPENDPYNIFLFGGSTTFGYGLPDDQTIASYLQEHLSLVASHDVWVYNFGRGSYVSGQELALFEQLLIAGFVPDLALFIDGLNEFAFPDGPAETRRLDAVFGRKRPALNRYPALAALPITRLAYFLRRSATRLFRGPPEVLPQNIEPTAAIDDGKYHDREIIARVITRYFENRKLIEAVANAYGARTAFVWQPIPLYKYDLRYHLFATGDFGSNLFALHGYRYMERRINERPAGEDFMWCADMQQSLEEPLYVDKVHYTAKMSRLLAATIGDLLVERGFLEN